MSYDPVKQRYDDERAPWLREKEPVAPTFESTAPARPKRAAQRKSSSKGSGGSWVAGLVILVSIGGGVMRAMRSATPAPAPPKFTLPVAPPNYSAPTMPNYQGPEPEAPPRTAEEVRQRIMEKSYARGYRPPTAPKPYAPPTPPRPGPFAPPQPSQPQR